MHNWSTNLRALKKSPRQFKNWQLEQMINFGADGKKINETELKGRWRELALDKDRRRFLGFLLWGKKFLTKDK